MTRKWADTLGNLDIVVSMIVVDVGLGVVEIRVATACDS